MKKRVTVLLLTLSLMAAYLPSIAFAEDEINKVDTKVTETTVDEGIDEDVVVDDNSESVDVNTPAKTENKKSVSENKPSLTNNKKTEEARPDAEEGEDDSLKMATFMTTTGTILSVQAAKKADDGNWYIKKPEDSITEKAGYTFLGWSNNMFDSGIQKWNKHPEFSGEPAEGDWEKYSQTLFAKWVADEYTFVMKNGSQQQKKVVSYREDFNLTCPVIFIPEKDNPNFDGWSDVADGESLLQDNETVTVADVLEYGFEAVQDEGTTLKGAHKYHIDVYATWTDLNKYNVNFHSSIPELVQLIVKPVRMPRNTKGEAGKSFTITSDKPAVRVTGIPVDLEGFIQWNTEPDGSGENYSAGSTIESLDGDIDLYAVWHLMPYSITYELNGGDPDSISEKDKFYFSGIAEFFVFPTPTKEGCEFVGWHYDPELKDDVVTEFTSNEHGDKKLYAEWKTAEYTVTFIDGFGGITTHKQEYGTETLLPPDPHRASMEFLGWSPKVEKYVTHDVVYKADWKFAGDISGIDTTGLDVVLTGDTTEMSLYITLALIAVSGMIVLIARRRRSN